MKLVKKDSGQFRILPVLKLMLMLIIKNLILINKLRQKIISNFEEFKLMIFLKIYIFG